MVYPVGHQHALKGVVGLDHQILLKADHLVNAGGSGDSDEAIYRMREVLFRIPTGTALLDQIDLA
ncbi:phosphohydrolase, partial [Bittarella massiliensis]|nr:phosphohydrolase [Bittarella massiliensis (ex Durand et al. 2017)]